MSLLIQRYVASFRMVNRRLLIGGGGLGLVLATGGMLNLMGPLV